MGPEVYISVDVEADGPVPGPYSLVSLGACVAAVRAADGRINIVDLRNMPPVLLGSRRHTHNALDDAKGQADLLAGILGSLAADVSIGSE